MILESARKENIFISNKNKRARMTLVTRNTDITKVRAYLPVNSIDLDQSASGQLIITYCVLHFNNLILADN